MNYYLIGILGSGMKSLAKILYQMGHIVSGCDYLGINHDLLDIRVDTFDNISATSHDYFIIGNAFLNHPMTLLIKKRNYRCESYVSFVSKLFKNMIAISGSHGKTSCAKMLYEMSHFNALIGDGEGYFTYKDNYFICEACEYKNHFLAYNPYISVILNVDYDHVDFFKSKKSYERAFYSFSQNSNYLICNLDDPYLKNLDHKRKIGYSFIDKDAYLYIEYEILNDFMRVHYFLLNKEYHFVFKYKSKELLEDFSAAFLVCHLLGFDDFDLLKKGLTISLPLRRLNFKEKNDNIYYLDYAHHPSQIKMVYNYLRLNHKDKKIVVIFEPHTISRTIYFLSDYKKVLNLFDVTYLYPLFTSLREEEDKIKTEYIYSYLGFEKYDFNKIKDLKGYVIAFLGAGKIDLEYNRF